MSRRRRTYQIDPNETFLDSSNLPEFDQHQFEGRIEKPISKAAVWLIGGVFLFIISAYVWKAWDLQVVQGVAFAKRSEENRLEHSVIFGPRGIIYDRNGVELVWNELPLSPTTTPVGFASLSSLSATTSTSTTPDGAAVNEFLTRKYKPLPGLAHVLGFVNYPGKDKSGVYYQTDIKGMDGVEKAYDTDLASKNGLKLREVDARGKVKSESVIEPPTPGKDIHLSIDSRVQSKLYEAIQGLAEKVDFKGGAGIIMDIQTGEILALTSYPEYSSEVLTEGDNNKIAEYIQDTQTPFLNRAIHGLYTPGSIVKPFMALAALNENIISPEKQIFSAGKITIPNPYHPDQPTIFRDWKAHGWVDMRRALAVSSDVYFYAVGGGYQDQAGLGIARIEKYMRMFGFAEKTGVDIAGEEKGTIPSPEWKKENFDGAAWLLGNTYHTAIGQYGFQTTPIQAVHAVGAMASGGNLVTPRLLKRDPGAPVPTSTHIPIPEADFEVIHEGMRMCVTDGICKGLYTNDVKVAAKTGTAELGVTKQRVNSWVTGFFPYDHPRYAFTVVMEKGPVTNLTGATFVMRQVVDFMARETPEYLK